MRAVLLLLLGLAALAGCIGQADDGGEPAPVSHHLATTAAPHVDAAALVTDLRSFAETYPVRAANRGDHEDARVWLMDKFASFGLETYRHDFNTDSLASQADIVGIKWGTLRDQWIVVGGHYDVVANPSCDSVAGNPLPVAPDCPTGVESQGMYDDGSGTMLTVHLAKAFANVDTMHTIAFVAFDGEELGLQGSGNFTETFPTGLSPYGNLTIHAMLDLDMFGLNWPSVDAPIYFDSNAPQLDDAVRGLAEGIGMPAEEVKYQGINFGRSDYAHFFELNVPTGFFISSFEEYQAPFNVPADGRGLATYPFWHTLDTWETMVAMAGSEDDVVLGFQTAADLAAGVLWHMDDASATYDVEIED
ncbi:MAG: M28 family metallopeptidase [Thermoplasmatota archaeon]